MHLGCEWLGCHENHANDKFVHIEQLSYIVTWAIINTEKLSVWFYCGIMSGRRKCRETESLFFFFAQGGCISFFLTGNMLILPYTPNDVLFFQIISLCFSPIPLISLSAHSLHLPLSHLISCLQPCSSSCSMSLSHFSSHFSVNYYFVFPTSNVFHSTVNTSGLPQLHTSISTWNTHKKSIPRCAFVSYTRTLSIKRPSLGSKKHSVSLDLFSGRVCEFLGDLIAGDESWRLIMYHSEESVESHTSDHTSSLSEWETALNFESNSKMRGL